MSSTWHPVPRFEVRKNRLTRRYRVALVGLNGETLTTSETLNSINAVHTNIKATMDAASTASHITWPE